MVVQASTTVSGDSGSNPGHSNLLCFVLSLTLQYYNCNINLKYLFVKYVCFVRILFLLNYTLYLLFYQVLFKTTNEIIFESKRNHEFLSLNLQGAMVFRFLQIGYGFVDLSKANISGKGQHWKLNQGGQICIPYC